MKGVSPQQKWNAANPTAMKAHKIVWLAKRRGEIVPEPCGICGASAEAHHPDHAEPLVVEWLCRFHHRRLHHRGEGDLFAGGA